MKIIILILIFVSVVAVIYINKSRNIAKTKGTVTLNSDLAFAVLGNVHGNIDTYKSLLMIYIQ